MKKYKYVNVKNSISSFGNRLKKPIGYVKSKVHILHNYLSGNNEYNEDKYGSFLYWLGDIVEYGLLINIPLRIFLDTRFNPLTIISYGIIWYMMQEFVKIVKTGKM